MEAAGDSDDPDQAEAVDCRIEVPLTPCPHCGDALASETDEILEQTLIEAAPVCPQVIREAGRLEASQVGFPDLRT